MVVSASPASRTASWQFTCSHIIASFRGNCIARQPIRRDHIDATHSPQDDGILSIQRRDDDKYELPISVISVIIASGSLVVAIVSVLLFRQTMKRFPWSKKPKIFKRQRHSHWYGRGR
ncbi:hypothetical protein EJ04DRAFT_513437 [Polyplosphaeria fusca]|uniref:Uncharacterized protein n=1 Tax=Polyplosphaeria fusca TaxID=682080 RepID=A0A9P4QX33_9PLEO|nr:hypothetical protein EJ04DRAFT_513437 [Polyplosphaeria fusca]